MDGRFMFKKSHLMSSQYDNDAFDDLSNELIEKIKYEYNMLQNVESFSVSDSDELRELNRYLDDEIKILKTVSFGDDRELSRYLDDAIKSLKTVSFGDDRELNRYLDDEIMSLKTVSFGDDRELRELNRYLDNEIEILRNLKIK